MRSTTTAASTPSARNSPTGSCSCARIRRAAAPSSASSRSFSPRCTCTRRGGGFLFDLRVDGGYQRRGIGRALSHEAEAASAARGATYLYLSVNGTNQKSRSLFNSMGWRPASRRCLVFRPLLLPQKVAAAAASLPPAAWPAPLEREAAERLAATTTRAATSASTARASALSSRPSCTSARGTPKTAPAPRRHSLWAGSAFVGFLPVRLLFLPARAWGYVILPALGAAAALGLAAAGAALANAAAVAGAAAAPSCAPASSPPPPPPPPPRGA